MISFKCLLIWLLSLKDVANNSGRRPLLGLGLGCPEHLSPVLFMNGSGVQEWELVLIGWCQEWLSFSAVEDTFPLL